MPGVPSGVKVPGSSAGDVEKALPPDWEWNSEWELEIGEHTDRKGWQYATTT